MRAFLFLPLLLSSVFAAEPVRYLAQPKVFVLDAGPVTYALGINERGELQPLHFGARLWRDEDFQVARSSRGWSSFDLGATTTPKEYAGYGGGLHVEPCLKATLADGVRDVVLVYVSHTIRGDTLEIVTKDIAYGLTATLHYKVFGQGIIRKHAVIANGTAAVVTLE
jgi:alpha-galactosidase